MKNLFTLTDQDTTELLRIRAAVVEKHSLGQLEALCAEVSPTLVDPPFALTYAAILLATRDRIAEAKKLFARNKDDAFCSVVCDYLDQTNSFSFGFTIFADASPYRAWFESDYHKQYQPGVMEHVAAFAKEHAPPTKDGTATIVDVGTGNGILLEKIINRIAPLQHLKRVKLVLIDPSIEMLKTARAHCEKTFPFLRRSCASRERFNIFPRTSGASSSK